MCTVTYIPVQKNHFILTSNRDEAPARSPKSISKKMLDNGSCLIFPQDTKAGGTWIAASAGEKVVCLLNGAFAKHQHRPPYKMSRGHMVLGFFDYRDTQDFIRDFDFEGIEPFTMVIFDAGRLYECRWDEHELHSKNLPPEAAHIWSSATLYPPDYQTKRVQIFEKWLDSEPDFSKENILKLHRTGSVGNPEYNFVMNRQNLVRTVSITCIEKSAQQLSMDYFDLLGAQPEAAISKSITLQPGK
ncbi:MAG TPA: NRDE family protein [Saprospiraceae bacterium]|nr:NRDE family protein [Saprospiraceae bacterium]